MKTSRQHRPLPYPQTPKTARAWMKDRGVCVSQWCRDLSLSRNAVVDLLRGQCKGNRGEAHRAAVALGLKADPDADQQLAV